jgi:hypothetical protein
MGQPITTKGPGICFAFPDVCNTPAPPSPSPVPVPYPNIGMLSDATGTASSVKAGGNEVMTNASEIPTTTGDEAGTAHPTTKGKVQFVTFSSNVKAEGNFVVRMFDTTTQNAGNAVGQVLGGVPTVLAGG